MLRKWTAQIGSKALRNDSTHGRGDWIYIYYEIDDDEVCSVLRLDEYGGDEDFSWVMLEAVDGATTA